MNKGMKRCLQGQESTEGEEEGVSERPARIQQDLGALSQREVEGSEWLPDTGW